MTKKDLEALGLKYAQGIFRGCLKSPEDLPELKARYGWESASFWEKKHIISKIAANARDRLLAAGLKRETVLKRVGAYM